MVPVHAPRFDISECSNELEREFIEALHVRAETGDWHADQWPWEGRLVFSVCASDQDPNHNTILRTLRIDFDGTTVLFGPDETHQFATDLDPKVAGVTLMRDRPILEMANEAANWLERELRRTIVRQEWDRPDGRGVAPRLWVLVDTSKPIVQRGICPTTPPDREIKVWPAK